MRLEELVLISTGAMLLFVPLLVGVLILRRVLRGEDFKDQDWRFLFGRPTFVAPYGGQWFVAIIVLAILGIAIYAPRFLR